MQKKEISDIVKNCTSKTHVCETLGLHPNGSNMKKVQDWIDRYKLDTTHFISYGRFVRKYQRVTKQCPVCNKDYETQKDHPREKQVCSRACSNTHFRSGLNNGNYKDGGNGDPEYRKICFKNYKKACLVCGFDKIVEVHHIDENHNNNDPSNLIPLCPNHHKMIHMMKYKQEVLDEIKNTFASQGCTTSLQN
jgi:hypothetical protein